MKHIQPVNEFWKSWKKAFIKEMPDDDIAQEILSFVGPSVEVTPSGPKYRAKNNPTKFSFKMKGSDISVEMKRGVYGNITSLKIDSAELHCKQELKDKLWNSLYQTWNKVHGPSAVKDKFRKRNRDNSNWSD